MKKGEIATIIAIGSMVFLLITSAVSTFLTKKPQITSTKAETVNCTYSIANRCFGECGETTPCPKCKNDKYRCPGTADDSPTTPSNTPIPPNTPTPHMVECCTISTNCGIGGCHADQKFVMKYNVTSCTGALVPCPASGVTWANSTEGCYVSAACNGGGGGGENCTATDYSCPTASDGKYNLKKIGTGTSATYKYFPSSNTDCSKDGYTSPDEACKQNPPPEVSPSETCSGAIKCPDNCKNSKNVYSYDSRFNEDGRIYYEGGNCSGNNYNSFTDLQTIWCSCSRQTCNSSSCADFGTDCSNNNYFFYGNKQSATLFYKDENCKLGYSRDSIKDWCCSAPSSNNLGKCIKVNLKHCSDFSCKSNTNNNNLYYQQGSENQFYQLVSDNCNLISDITTYCCNSGPPPADGSVEVTTGEANPVTINSAVLNGFYAKSGDNITITETGFIFLGENYNTNTVNTPFNRQVSFGESSMHPTYQYQAYVKYLDSGVERTATDKNGSKSFVPVAVQSSTQYKCKDPTSYNNGTYDLLDYPQTFVRDCLPEIEGKRYFYVSGKDSNDICIMKCKKINELYNTSYTGDCNSDTGSEDTCISKYDKPNANKFDVTVAFGISKNCGNSGGKITGVGLSLDEGAVLDSKSFDPPITDYKTTNFTLKLEKGKLYRLRAWMNVQKGTGIYAYYSDVKVVDPNSDSSGISIGVQHDDDDCSN